MLKQIHGAPHGLRLSAFKSWGLLDEVDALDAVADAAWGEIFEGIRSGSYRIAYWDSKPADGKEYYCFMRYALHRSTKQDGFLQLSVMEVRNGEIIPTSDTQHDTFKSFLEEAPRDAVVTIR